MQQAKIFLAEERGVMETDWYRSYSTFNFSSYYNEHKTPVEKLFVCNDETLAGGKSFVVTPSAPTQLILLPVVGAIVFKKDNEATLQVNAGELLSVYAAAGESFELVNPYETELINFLQLRLMAEREDAPAQLVSFNIESKNRLLPLLQTPQLQIAKLEGREEVVYKPLNENNCVFALAVQGAFEAEGVLLQPGDGVAFWNYKQIETEALSNDAIIILLEMNTA